MMGLVYITQNLMLTSPICTLYTKSNIMVMGDKYARDIYSFIHNIKHFWTCKYCKKNYYVALKI